MGSNKRYSVNFEVSNFISLDDTRGEKHFYAITGAEHTNLLHHYRPNLWVEGLVTRRLNGSANFQPISSGMSDWGNIYALTAFKDTKNNGRRVQWGWSDEGKRLY
jgi:beta-fructofuranosidase